MNLVLASIVLGLGWSGNVLDAQSPAPARDHAVNLVIADQKTPAPRTTDTVATARKQRQRTVDQLVRFRAEEDENFAQRAAKLYAAIGLTAAPTALMKPSTGAAFLDALVFASRQGPIGSLVIYGHSSPAALYMMEDRGFYRSVKEVAEQTPILPAGTADATEKEKILRSYGARDLSDLEALVQQGEIRFAPDAMVIFTGCAAGGEHQIDPKGIAGSLATIGHATVIASQGVTDQSMAGRNGYMTRNEYSRGSWVLFSEKADPLRLGTRVLDPLKTLASKHLWTPGETWLRADSLLRPLPLYLCADESVDGRPSVCAPEPMETTDAPPLHTALLDLHAPHS
ncbi:MAG TPA: hypothetical protein VGG12_01195 [Methylovirgula sp.]|jgi:hypothetical protein